ncbi:unnamed protein product [Closterium sp. Naga37s-1]|nr:unnamed protein product [Closterium sp. Naga37s-1]
MAGSRRSTDGAADAAESECRRRVDPVLIAPNFVVNTFALIDPSGAPIVRYNKSHLFPSVEANVQPGPGTLPVVDGEASGHSAAAQLDVGHRSCATAMANSPSFADPSPPFPLHPRHPQSGHSAAAQLDVGRHRPHDIRDGCSEGSRERAHTAALLLHWGLGRRLPVLPHPCCTVRAAATVDMND